VTAKKTQPDDRWLHFFSPYFLFWMPSPLHISGYSNEPSQLASVEHPHDEMDVTLAAEKVDATSDSDINPGELSFEEGLSLQPCFFQENF
jgi:hypothetical protein